MSGEETGEAVERSPKSKGGRPSKARGASASADAADARWTVRGVPQNVRNMAVKAADFRGMTVGDWVSEAIVAYYRSANPRVMADAQTVSADAASSVPAVPLSEELAKALGEIQDRLTRLEAERKRPILKRLFGGRG